MVTPEERAAFKKGEGERIADLHPGVTELLAAERRATVEALGRAILHRIGVESAPTYNGQAARRVRAWITGIVEMESNELLKNTKAAR